MKSYGIQWCMLSEIITNFEKGMDHGIVRSIEVLMFDPAFHEERPQHTSRAFNIGEQIGRYGGGAIMLWFGYVGSLGILPSYNLYVKHYRGKH